MQQILIIADDLSGAADCGMACAGSGLHTLVMLGNSVNAVDADVLSVDADTRGLDPKRAVWETAMLMRRYMSRREQVVFKKLDSTLRGNVGAELAAVLTTQRGAMTQQEHIVAVLAPAFPANGRTTKQGKQLLNGKPLEEMEIWRRNGIQGSSYIPTMLESAGYRDILTADSAEAAYRILGIKDASHAAKVDLILLDVLMPAVNGIQVCRRIKSIDRLRDIPVVIVTVQSDPVDLQLAFAEGAIDYIRKPLIKVEMLARVRSVLRLAQEITRRKSREQELLQVMQQLEEANERFRQLSSQDGLTEIANRRRFDEFFEQEWRRAVRDALPVSLISISSKPITIPMAISPETIA